MFHIINKKQLIKILKTLTPLTDEINIIEQFCADEYLYFIRDADKHVIGIYDYLLDLTTLTCSMGDCYVEKIKVIWGYSYGDIGPLPFSHQTFSSHYNIYDEKHDKWFEFFIIHSVEAPPKGEESIYIPGIRIVKKFHGEFDQYQHINTMMVF